MRRGSTSGPPSEPARRATRANRSASAAKMAMMAALHIAAGRLGMQPSEFPTQRVLKPCSFESAVSLPGTSQRAASCRCTGARQLAGKQLAQLHGWPGVTQAAACEESWSADRAGRGCGERALHWGRQGATCGRLQSRWKRHRGPPGCAGLPAPQGAAARGASAPGHRAAAGPRSGSTWASGGPWQGPEC